MVSFLIDIISQVMENYNVENLINKKKFKKLLNSYRYSYHKIVKEFHY